MKLLCALKPGEELPELPAMKHLRLGNGTSDSALAVTDEQDGEQRAGTILPELPLVPSISVMMADSAKPRSPLMRKSNSTSSLRSGGSLKGPGMLLQLAMDSSG